MRGVGAIIADGHGRWLIQHHVKHKKLSLPGGKINDGETVIDGLSRELLEELDITVQSICWIDTVSKQYHEFGEEHSIAIYLIEKYKGTIKNLEPEKHSALEWMSVEDLHALPRDMLADVITIALNGY